MILDLFSLMREGSGACNTAAAPNIQGVLYARGQSMDAIVIDGRGTFRSRLPVVAIRLPWFGSYASVEITLAHVNTWVAILRDCNDLLFSGYTTFLQHKWLLHTMKYICCNIDRLSQPSTKELQNHHSIATTPIKLLTTQIISWQSQPEF
jgi:hypothetical protein